MKYLLIFLLCCAPVFSMAQSRTVTDTVRVHAEEMKWGDAPAPFPPGAYITVIEGNSKESGLFTIRVKFPPHYLIPAHFHPEDERVTVIGGSVYIGFGELADTTKGTKFTRGDYYVNPKNSHHYVYTKDESAVLQLNCEGPWGLSFCK